MARPLKIDTQSRALGERLRKSMLVEDYQSLPTELIVSKLVSLLVSKDTSTLTTDLIRLVESRDLGEIPAEARLNLMTNLQIKSRLPPEEALSLEELRQVKGKDVKITKDQGVI